MMQAGKILWHDLTVPNAPEVRDFYRAVVGWEASSVNVGEVEDYNMLIPGEDAPTAGICHAVGINANLPPVWLVYIMVDNLAESLQAVERLGGAIVVPPRGDGNQMAVIRDPAGAYIALYHMTSGG